MQWHRESRSRLVGELEPDVVLMDIRMPELDGLEATRRILALPNAPRVIVLTTFDMNEYVYEAMKAGASGFLLKDTRGDSREARTARPRPGRRRRVPDRPRAGGQVAFSV